MLALRNTARIDTQMFGSRKLLSEYNLLHLRASPETLNATHLR